MAEKLTCYEHKEGLLTCKDCRIALTNWARKNRIVLYYDPKEILANEHLKR